MTTNIREHGKVLSIYLNVDQSYAANRLRAFETVLKDGLRDIESRLTGAEELAEFRQSAEAALHAVHAQQPGSGTLIVFAQPNGKVRTRQLEVSIETSVRWQDHPYLQPILAAEDEFKPLLVVITDHQHARLLTSVLGHLAEHPKVENAFPSKHTKTAGKNRAKSQTVFNRKSDERVSGHLKNVAEAVAMLSREQMINRIILAGNDETSKELHRLLSPELRRQVVSFLTLPADAAKPQIAEAVASVGYRTERQAEIAKVDSLLQLAGPHAKAVVGVQETMDALKEGRALEFVYSEGVRPVGAHCAACDAVFVDCTICPACQATLKPVEDVVDHAIEAALKTGATVEQVRGVAAEKMLAVGGFGGFLRY